jgi:hypothetical protein
MPLRCAAPRSTAWSATRATRSSTATSTATSLWPRWEPLVDAQQTGRIILHWHTKQQRLCCSGMRLARHCANFGAALIPTAGAGDVPEARRAVLAAGAAEPGDAEAGDICAAAQLPAGLGGPGQPAGRRPHPGPRHEGQKSGFRVQHSCTVTFSCNTLPASCRLTLSYRRCWSALMLTLSGCDPMWPDIDLVGALRHGVQHGGRHGCQERSCWKGGWTRHQEGEV